MSEPQKAQSPLAGGQSAKQTKQARPILSLTGNARKQAQALRDKLAQAWGVK